MWRDCRLLRDACQVLGGEGAEAGERAEVSFDADDYRLISASCNGSLK